MKPIPIYDATVPIVCTASREEVPERIDQIEQLRANLRSVERTETGMVLRFPDRPEVDSEVRRFAAQEKACCQFWGFEVVPGEGELLLRWDAPPAVDDLVDRLLAYFEGDEPLTSIAGLL